MESTLGYNAEVAFYCRRMILRRILKKRWWQQQHFASFQTAATFDNVESLALAAEEMVVCHFKQMNILTAIITLIASYYVLNADYPKGLGSHCKNIYLFFEHVLLPKLKQGSAKQLPISVQTVVAKLNGMAYIIRHVEMIIQEFLLFSCVKCVHFNTGIACLVC